MALWASVVVIAVATQAAGTRVENLYRYGQSKTMRGIRKCDFVADQHEVTSSDGYITTLFRLHSRKQRGDHTVIVQHGFLASSDKWFHEGNNSLPCVVGHDGFDVWLVNARGNRYSQKHTTLSANSEEYWNFSFHEMGVNDLPAIIDYVLNVTKKPTLSYVGKGFGANIVLALLSDRPDYNDKIERAITMGPASHLSNTDDQIVKFMAYLPEYMDGHWKNWTNGKIPHWFPEMPGYENETYIRDTTKILAEILQLDRDNKNDKSEHVIESCSVKVAGHLGQLVRNGGGFNKYDYGKAGNEELYGQEKVPGYKLAKIRTRQFLIYDPRDRLINVKDVNELCDALPHISNSTCRGVPSTGFRHGNFLRGDYAREVYRIVLEELRETRRAGASRSPASQRAPHSWAG